MLVTYDTSGDAKLTTSTIAAQAVWNTAGQKATLSQRQWQKSTI